MVCPGKQIWGSCSDWLEMRWDALLTRWSKDPRLNFPWVTAVTTSLWNGTYVFSLLSYSHTYSSDVLVLLQTKNVNFRSSHDTDFFFFFLAGQVYNGCMPVRNNLSWHYRSPLQPLIYVLFHDCTKTIIENKLVIIRFAESKVKEEKYNYIYKKAHVPPI